MTNTPLPRRIYTPGSPLQQPGALIKDLVVDLVRGRELAWRLFVRDLNAQYRQSFFGYIWVFLPPLAASLTFIWLQRQGIVNVDTGAVPYGLFALTGTLLWQTFVDAIVAPMLASQQAKPILSKINFPREAILLSGLYGVLFSLAVRLVLVMALVLYWGISINASLAWFPFALMGLISLGFALGLLLTPLAMLYTDISKGIYLIAQFWMLLSPVLYPFNAEGHGLAQRFMWFNPVAPLLETARSSLLGGPLAGQGMCIGISLGALLVVAMGLISYRIAMPHLVARM